MHLPFEFCLHAKQKFVQMDFVKFNARLDVVVHYLPLIACKLLFSYRSQGWSQKQAFPFYDAKYYGKVLRSLNNFTFRLGLPGLTGFWWSSSFIILRTVDLSKTFEVSSFPGKQQGLSSVVSRRCHQFQNSQASRKISRFTKFLLKNMSNSGIYNAPQTPSGFNQLPS